jgi:hypothetical protein
MAVDGRDGMVAAFIVSCLRLFLAGGLVLFASNWISMASHVVVASLRVDAREESAPHPRGCLCVQNEKRKWTHFLALSHYLFPSPATQANNVTVVS